MKRAVRIWNLAAVFEFGGNYGYRCNTALLFATSWVKCNSNEI
jgi:hypothetical protein